MGFLSFLLIICLSHLSKGQNVSASFINTLVYDDFSSNRKNFPQKYNTSELSTFENGLYRLKRMSGTDLSIVYLNTPEDYASYEVSAKINLLKSKPAPSAGIVLHGQRTRGGGILVEFNAKKQFRVTKQSGSNLRLLSGTPRENGWVKSKNLNKSGFNTIAVKTKASFLDIYINDKYTYTVFDVEFSNGNVGLFVAAQSEIIVDDFAFTKEESSIDKVLNKDPKNTESNESVDTEFQEIILIFKTKINRQQVTIENLEKELNKCNSMLTYDTTLTTRAKSLESSNKILKAMTDSLSRELNKSKKRLSYLESMKEDVEKGSNGDLVLNLTSILAESKKENKSLKQNVSAMEQENTSLKDTNKILLREIERLKYLINLKE